MYSAAARTTARVSADSSASIASRLTFTALHLESMGDFTFEFVCLGVFALMYAAYVWFFTVRVPPRRAFLVSNPETGIARVLEAGRHYVPREFGEVTSGYATGIKHVFEGTKTFQCKEGEVELEFTLRIVFTECTLNTSTPEFALSLFAAELAYVLSSAESNEALELCASAAAKANPKLLECSIDHAHCRVKGRRG